MHRLTLFLVVIALSGCTPRDYPELLPLSDLLAGSARTAEDMEAEAELDARAARLEARADALRLARP